MDELYENAWGEPSKATTEHLGSTSTSRTWTSTKLPSLTTHEEPDLAAPSWAAGEEIQWGNPSDDSNSFSWANVEPDLAWGASPHTDLNSDRGDVATDATTPTQDEEQKAQKEEPEDEVQPSASSPVLTEPHPASRMPSPHLNRQHTPVDYSVPTELRSSSPEGDAFGTFETAFDTRSKPFSSGRTPELEPDAWGSPWGGGAEEEESSETAPVDEWEAARQQKERLDRKIPPEVLAEILAQCNEYCRHAWPETEQTKADSIPEAEWMSNWRDGMDSIEGLETLMQSIVPELTLEPPVKFTKTAIAKNMATAVRSTKNLPVSKTSPMSHYLAARGSTAWEDSVRERKVAEKDVIPVGWRVLDKPTVNTTTEPAKNAKPGGGIFSFWSRRQSRNSTSQGSSDSTREQSPSATNSPILPPGEVSGGPRSARASQDSVRSRTAAKDEKVASPLAEPSLHIPTVPEAAGQSTAPALYSEAPEPIVDGSHTPPPPQAPSAVSRFLHRFSRRQSTTSVSSSHSSFALSTDDLEFLADIVPSAQDVDDEIETYSKSLSNVLKPEPLPPALPPPPSAASRPSSTIPSKSTPPPSSAPLLPTSKPPLSKPPQKNDLAGLDFFGAFETSATSAGNAALTLTSSGRSATEPAKPARYTSPPPLFTSPLIPSQRSTSQPFHLPPPPPSSSRPQTPSSLVPTPPLMSSLTSPVSERKELERSRSPALRPKVPLSFTMPPQSAVLAPSAPPTASSVMSTMSEVPLGELYPHAVAKAEAPNGGTAGFSAFALPPPPSSRPFIPSPTHTPGGAPPPLLSPPPSSSIPSSSKPLIPPPPQSQQHRAVTVNLLDDDDFADFQSSETSPVDQAASAAPTVQSKPSTQMPFKLPPPPPFGRKTPTPGLSSLPPPPQSRATILSSVPTTPQPRSSDPFTDDFSASLASPSSTVPASSTRSSGLGFSFNSDKSLLTPQKGRRIDSYDAESPSSSALRTPSPPRPISKSPRHMHQPTTSLARPGEKKVKASQHLHTLSLMERAAATPGRWPAPPSPLPQALSFPGPGPPPKGSVDLLGDESFGSFQSDTMSPSSSSPLDPMRPSSVTLPQPSQSVPSLSQTSGTGSGYSVLRASSTSSSNNSMKASGLSAQDLSFFEGL